MVKELERAKKVRGQIKGQVTRIEMFLNLSKEVTAAEARVRLKRLEDLCKSFEEVQQQIELLEPAEAAAAAPLKQKAKKNVGSSTNDTIQQLQSVIDAAQEVCEQRMKKTVVETIILPAQQHYLRQEQQPDLKLPEFTGKFTE